MTGEDVSGYLDVKISAKGRRGLTPWKAWQKQWCELKRLDSIENGVELKLKSSNDGTLLNCLLLPRSVTICRTESRTKQYAFGVFAHGRTQKPLIFLSGASESDSQYWISQLRGMVSITSYLPIGDSNYHISVIDNVHSRSAGLLGLHGVLGTNSQEIMISDPFTGDTKLYWQWYYFHQFHFQSPSHQKDDKKIIVMHTSSEFPSGPGQIYLFCEQGPTLLNNLVARGNTNSEGTDLKNSKRFSRSEGDLRRFSQNFGSANSPMFLRSQASSDDSGVTDDLLYATKQKTANSLLSLGLGILTKTPGGSESNDSTQDLTQDSTAPKGNLPRQESGISLASGIYEEIDDNPTTSQPSNHIYENPLDLVQNIKPPPLPPRIFNYTGEVYSKKRCNTLPAKDLSRLSKIFTAENEYVAMSPKGSAKTKDKSTISAIAESLYMPMSPVISLKNKLENCYMIMNGK